MLSGIGQNTSDQEVHLCLGVIAFGLKIDFLIDADCRLVISKLRVTCRYLLGKAQVICRWGCQVSGFVCLERLSGTPALT